MNKLAKRILIASTGLAAAIAFTFSDAAPKATKAALASACLWEETGGFLHPSGTVLEDTAAISIRKSDGSIFGGQNAWRDYNIFDTTQAFPFNAMFAPNLGDPSYAFSQVEIIDSDNWSYSSQWQVSQVATESFSSSAIALVATTTNAASFIRIAGDSEQSTLPIHYMRDWQTKFSVDSAGAIKAGGAASWKLGAASGGTITVEIDGQKYAITATPIP